jgi:hypothetical protein
MSAVFIAPGEKVESIFNSSNPFLLEEFGKLWSYSLYILDRGQKAIPKMLRL